MKLKLQFFAEEDTQALDLLNVAPIELTAVSGVIGTEQVKKGNEILKEYKEGKKNFESRIVENNKWYELNHWEAIKEKTSHSDSNKPEPRSAWLFNSIANKHADAMDNYPVPAVLPRERGDVEEAKNLSSILPVILQQNNFEDTYSDEWWEKLKNGLGIYGVFWNSSLLNGLGDIDIKCIDGLNIFWQPGVTDIQKSRNVFTVDLVDNDILETVYPATKGLLGKSEIKLEEYVYEDKIDTSNKSLVIDWYYKKTNENGKQIVHYIKYVGETLLYASENDPAYAQNGYYNHGMYPFVFDKLFPMVGSPAGYGYIDIMKDTQMQIDKLKQIISTNAHLVGTPRFFKAQGTSVNIKEFADYNKQFVNVNGSLDDTKLKQIQVAPLDGWIQSFYASQIEELKETSNNRDVSNGGATGGVTSGAGISALQEAGNKLSRDMLKSSYRAYEQVCNLVIELIRQFYDETREFRILGDDNQQEFIGYNNANIKVADAEDSRLAVFDLKIKAQKSNPFSRMAQNELAQALFQMGAFNPEMADQSMIMFDMMDFEGKDQLLEKINTNKTLAKQNEMIIQILATYFPQVLPVVQQQLQMMELQGQAVQPMPNSNVNVSSQNVAMNNALTNATTPYQQRLAERSMVDVNDTGTVQ